MAAAPRRAAGAPRTLPAAGRRSYKLAAVWTVENLHALAQHGLPLDRFLLAFDGAEIVACGVLWDQRAFRQTVIHGYSRPLAFARRLVNPFSPNLSSRGPSRQRARPARPATARRLSRWLAPERDAAGHWSYTLFAEGELPRDLAARLETQLRENPHYALCRDLGQLGPLRCCRIAPGAFEIFCRAGVFAGQRLGDLKPQSLSPRTDWQRHFTTAFESS